MDLNQPIYLSQEDAEIFQRFGGNSRLLSLSLQAMIEEDIKAELEEISRSQSSSLDKTDTLKQVVDSLDFLLEDNMQQVSHSWNSSVGPDCFSDISNTQDVSCNMGDNSNLVPLHSYQAQHHQQQEQFTSTQFMQPPSAGMKKKKANLPGNSGEVSKFPKPALSFTCLIGLALKNSQTGCMAVAEIYNFICEHFPYFTTAPPGWKNSVRHNISLNKLFTKVEKQVVYGDQQRRAFLWAVNPLHPTKVDEEIKKCLRRNPIGIQKGMLMPESLEALERGEMVRDYSCSKETIFSEISD